MKRRDRDGWLPDVVAIGQVWINCHCAVDGLQLPCPADAVKGLDAVCGDLPCKDVTEPPPDGCKNRKSPGITGVA